MLQLAVDNTNHKVPGFRIDFPSELENWLKTNGFRKEGLRRSNWFHYQTGRELQLYSWYSSARDDTALEFVSDYEYDPVDDVVLVKLWMKLLSTSAPIILPNPLTNTVTLPI